MTHVSLSFFHFTVQRLCRHEGLLRHDGQGPAQSHDPRWILHFRHRLDRQNVQTLAHPRGKKTSSLSITFQSARSAPARPLLHLLLLPPDLSVVGRRSFSLILPSIICFCFVCRSNCFFLLFLSFSLSAWRQLSYADTHPMFTRKSYPNFFRIVPSENAFNAPRVKLLQAFNWTRVGTLYQNEPRFALVSVLDVVPSSTLSINASSAAAASSALPSQSFSI